MAVQEQVERLKRSVEEWNEWRWEDPKMEPDLSGADLSEMNLCNANLSHVDLSNASFLFARLNGASLMKANLSGAHFSQTASGRDYYCANLTHTSLSGANLSGAVLCNVPLDSADLTHTDLSGANLHKAKFMHASLMGTNLNKADLTEANLYMSSLCWVDLSGANFNGTHFYSTTFAWVDLSLAKGRKKARHDGPSVVDINSVIFPRDESTRLHFLRGVGFTEVQIEYLPSLLTPRPIQHHSLFISYAHQDEAIAKRLHTDLRKKDVPCWFAPHDMKIGDKIRPRIDQAIHAHDKLLLLLSEHALRSDWVEDEVEAAIEKERQQKCEVLFPIRLDSSVMTTTEAWAAKLRRSRHIGDFTNWQKKVSYRQAFTRLLQDLKVPQSLVGSESHSPRV